MNSARTHVSNYTSHTRTPHLGYAAKRRAGIGTVWVVAWGPAFLALFVLVTDIGHLWLARVELENAVEAGALAGAKVWGDHPDNSATRTAAHTAAKRFTQANMIVGAAISIDDNNSTAGTNNNAVCPGQVLLGAITGTTFQPAQVPSVSSARGCRVEATASVDSLWVGFAGRFTVRASAVARYDGEEGMGTPRLVRVTSVTCM